jgi:hypothetical protein
LVGAEEVVLVGDVEVGEKVTGFEVGFAVGEYVTGAGVTGEEVGFLLGAGVTGDLEGRAVFGTSVGLLVG